VRLAGLATKLDAVSGLVGVNVPNMVSMLDWAYLAPRPQSRLAGPCALQLPQGSTSSCLSVKHSPYLIDKVPGAMYKQGEDGKGAEKQRSNPA